MDWRSRLRTMGVPGGVALSLLTFCGLVWLPWALARLAVAPPAFSAGLLLPFVVLHHWAVAPTTGWWGGPLAVLVGLVCWGSPIFVAVWWWHARRPAPGPGTPVLYRNPSYEAQLARLMHAVNALRPEEPVPATVRRQLVQVIRLVEAGALEILGNPPRAQCRLLWLVRTDLARPVVWARRTDGRLGPREEQIVTTCLTQSWFTALDQVPTNPLFRPTPPERMQTLVAARNLQDWRVGFVLAVDVPWHLSSQHIFGLLGHLALLLPLFDLDAVRRVMVYLQREDFWGGDA